MLENKMVVDWYWNDEWYWDTKEEEQMSEDVCSVDEIENLETMLEATEETLKELVKKITGIFPVTAEWDNQIDAIVYTY